MQTNRSQFLQLSGESSPTSDQVFDPAPDFQRPSSAKRPKPDITGVYDNVQEALAQPVTPAAQHLQEPLIEESPKSVNYFCIIIISIYIYIYVLSISILTTTIKKQRFPNLRKVV